MFLMNVGYNVGYDVDKVAKGRSHKDWRQTCFQNKTPKRDCRHAH